MSCFLFSIFFLICYELGHYEKQIIFKNVSVTTHHKHKYVFDCIYLKITVHCGKSCAKLWKEKVVKKKKQKKVLIIKIQGF